MCYIPPARGIDVDRIMRNIGLALRRALVQVAVVAAVVAQQQVEQEEEEALYAVPPPSPSSPIFRSDSPTPSTPPPLSPSQHEFEEHNPSLLGPWLNQSLQFLTHVDDQTLRSASVHLSIELQHSLEILADVVPLFPQDMDRGW
jgi:hypothetical protein